MPQLMDEVIVARSLFFGILLATFSAQADVGFKGGNNLTAVLARGEISVRCQMGPGGGPDFGNFSCRKDILETGEYDYFVGPERIQGNEVALTATHEDGSKRSKTVDYDSAKGQSSKPVNLWIATLLQRPLLDGGENLVSYAISYKGKVTARGEFKATVKDGGVKFCPRRGHYFSTNSNDCRTGGDFCNKFFRENNYCL